jgi:hypothetical protein
VTAARFARLIRVLAGAVVVVGQHRIGVIVTAASVLAEASREKMFGGFVGMTGTTRELRAPRPVARGAHRDAHVTMI